MKSTTRFRIASLALCAWFGCLVPARAAEKFDVVVYGATPGGIAAAVNAAREGATVALIQEDGHVGGLTSGGLSNPDFLSFEALGGAWREFMHRVERHYVRAHGADSQQVVDSVRGAYSEPRVARQVFEEMLGGEKRVATFLHHRLARATTVDAADGRKRLTAAVFTDQKTQRPREIEATVFIDGTYEGDLLAAAGARHRVGCESKEEYGESLAFDEANRHVMTYNFRVCLTTDRANFVPIPKPEGYRREAYAPLVEWIREGKLKGLHAPRARPAIFKVRPIPNQKADWNDEASSPISLSLENVNHPWPEGSPEVRERIFNLYKDHSLGLFWFLANDPEVPEGYREEMSRWGLPKDEYPDSGHWSPALYVREGRRLVGEYVFTEKDTQPAPGSVRAPVQPESVAIGDYVVSSHGTSSPAFGVTIGRLGKPVRPFQIPYGVLLPRDVDGLLVPVAASSSHVGFSALRMEPTWMNLGQAAGVAAATAVKKGGSVRAVSVPALQERLWDLGAMTVYVTDLTPRVKVKKPAWDPPGSFEVALHPWPVASPWFKAAQFFGTQGYFHDLVDPRTPAGPRPPTTGQWGGAYPLHEAGVALPIDEALAARWTKRAGVEQTPDLKADGRLTRGEFLNRLYARLPR